MKKIPTRTLRIWTMAAVCVISAAVKPAGAQQADNKPPVLEKLEEGNQPTTSTPSSATNSVLNSQITEKRERGQVTQVRVQNGNNVYYVKPTTPASSSLHGGAQNNAIRAPQWQILEFDWNREKEMKNPPANTAIAPAPPAGAAPNK